MTPRRETPGGTYYAAGVDRPFRMHFGSWEPYRIGFDEPGREYGQSVILANASAVDSIGSLALWPKKEKEMWAALTAVGPTSSTMTACSSLGPSIMLDPCPPAKTAPCDKR